MIEIPYSDVISGISIVIWPGKNRQSGLEEFGSPNLDFGGEFFFGGGVAGHFAG